MLIKKKLDMNFNNCLFIIHNDLDGISCEVLAKFFFKDKIDKISFKIIESCDGDRVLKEAIESGLHDCILMCDCSFKEEETFNIVINYIEENKNQFFLIDHHINALKCADCDWAFVSINEYDHKNSGTELLFQFLGKQIKIEESLINKLAYFVELVRNYDTWDWFYFRNKKSEVSYGLSSICNFDNRMFVEDMLENLNNDSNNLLNEKHELLIDFIKKSNKNYIDKVIKNIKFQYHNCNKCVAMLVANQLHGEIANKVFELYPKTDFITFITSPCSLSFRSTDERENVFIIANSLNGEGHRNSSECYISNELTNFIGNLIFYI